MKIYLRNITLNDGALIVKWRNAPNVSSHCFNKNAITLESNKMFYKEFVETGRYKQFIVEKMEESTGVSSYPIATVYLKDIDKVNRRCELCVFTSDDEEWNDVSKSIAIKMLLEKAFMEYNMHKVYSYVFAEFLDEAALLKNAGFRSEAILSGETVSANGSFADVIRFCIFNPKDERKV